MPKSGTVLVVDDYEPNLRGLGQLLQRADYDVLTATNGRDALDIVKRERPDLVLLDVLMPGISGLDVCAELKRSVETRFTPVVLISGAQERQTRLAGLEAGADDFLNKPIDPEELQTRVRSLMRLKRLTDDLDSAASLFLTLGRIIEARDPCTEGHCERLTDYATALGRHLDLGQTDLEALNRGAFLHDVGKIAIPDRVLLKKGKLTRKEYDLMKRHPAIGDQLCATVRSFEAVRPIVRHHHERLDGRGYPDGLAGDRIPLLAQIVSIVDVFDALTSDRPYRKALPTATAYQMMRDQARGGWCRQDLLAIFIDLHGARERERAGIAV
ncbi:MAG TPA: HD domain-containing phosphohydrolase [Vicinamibacterales bacterium]|jgi:putative two-component system response regulator|nr:HD domain-containing phosphohydrolase [Vicinamibacterales bacterium]